MKKTLISQSPKDYNPPKDGAPRSDELERAPEEKKELQELLQNIKGVNKIRYFVISVFFFITLIQKLTETRPITWGLLLLIFLLIVLLAIFDFLLRKTRLKETVTRTSIFSLIHLTMEVTMVLMILHLGGAMAFSGIIFLIAYLFIPYFLFTRRNYCWAVITFCVLDYTVIISLEHLGILGFVDLFNLGIDVMRNREVFLNVFTAGIPLLLMIIYLVDSFSSRLRDSLKSLSQKERELRGAKAVLEIKVKARTKALVEERASLEVKVKERTKELQEKIEELEKFQKIVVGRELKMVELKKEIKELKKELGE